MAASTDSVQDDPFGDLDAPLVDPRPVGFLEKAAAEQEAAADAERAVERAWRLEALAVRADQVMADQAQLISELIESLRIVREHRDELVVRSEEAVGLKVALKQRTQQLADATEAADCYRAELKRVLEGIAALAHSTLDSD